MKKVILHNLSIPYAQASPGHYNFDQGGVLFAEPEDIVVTREPISNAYLQFLETIGYNFDRLSFVSPETSASPNPNSIFTNRSILQQVTSFIDETSDSAYTLDSFMVTTAEANWANEIGIRYIENPAHYFTFGNKSYFRKLMKKNGMPIPFGFEYQKDKVSGAIKAAFIFLFARGHEVVVKQDEGVAAFGSSRFTQTDLFENHASLEKLFPDPRLTGIIPTHSSSFVVEKWYQNVQCSPSIQIYISPDSEVTVLSLHLQMFNADKMRYAGCASVQWLKNELQNRLKNEGSKIGEILSQKGFRGHFTLNSIVLKNGELFWVELNPRRVISSYPFQIAKKISPDTPEHVPYIAKNIQKNKWRGKTIDFILSDLAPILFDPSTGSGVVPIHYNYLPNSGSVLLMCIGRTQAETEHVFRKVIAV